MPRVYACSIFSFKLTISIFQRIPALGILTVSLGLCGGALSL